MYDEIMKIHEVRKEVRKQVRKTGEISPLHLKYIFVWFTLITKKSWQNIYEEVYFLCCCQNVMLSHFFREVHLTEWPGRLKYILLNSE